MKRIKRPEEIKARLAMNGCSQLEISKLYGTNAVVVHRVIYGKAGITKRTKELQELISEKANMDIVKAFPSHKKGE